MHRGKVILTIGGGGVTHGTDPALDEFCLQFVPEAASLGYFGWANGDDETRIRRFHDRFSGYAGALSHAPQGMSSDALRAWMADKDLVYLGGGATDILVQALGSDALLPIFRAAYDRGCVLAGVSAGGVCWYDWILSDAGGQGYRPLPGLGLVAHGVCPHYSSEPERRRIFEDAIARSPTGQGYAVDDGVCLVSVDGSVTGYYSTRSGHAAYVVTSSDGTPATAPLPAISAVR